MDTPDWKNYIPKYCIRGPVKIRWLLPFQETNDDDDDSEPAEDMEAYEESGMLEDDSVSDLWKI